MKLKTGSIKLINLYSHCSGKKMWEYIKHYQYQEWEMTTLQILQTSKGSVQFSCSVISNSLWPHGPQHARPPYPSPTPRVYSNSRPLSRWCHLTISSSVIPFSSCPQSFPASGSFRWVSSLQQVAEVLEFQLQHQSFQWTLRNDLL